MKMNDLNAKWITNGKDKPFYVRKSFEIASRPARVWIAVCGLGQFILYINGKKVSENVLDPAWTDYNKCVNYLEFDITEYIETGENVIAAEIGNGWFIMDGSDGNYTFGFPPFMPENPNKYKPFSSVLMFFADIRIDMPDGTVLNLCTDETWKTKESMTALSNVFGSETIDGRKRDDGWNKNESESSDGWENAIFVKKEDIPKGHLEPQAIPSVRKLQTYKAVYIGKIKNRLIYDLSQNISGMLEFDVIGKKG